MADRSVLVRLMANVADFKAQMGQAQRSVKGVGDESEKTSREASTALGRLAQSAQKNRDAWNDAGTAMTAVGAVTAVAIGGSIKAAIDWESAWAGVTKTVEGTPQQLAKVEGGLRGLARTLPATHDEIAAVAEAAGQLGVQLPGIVSFTKTMVDLGETTNLSAEEAATSIAQMMNVMRTAPEDVGRLGATLVALGNDGASTEKQIIEMAQRISGAAAVVGMSEGEVLALANAVASMGIEVESGGTSVSRVLTDMSKAAQTGGADLEVFAKTAGMSAAEFSEAFLNDPARAFEAFTSGLGGIVESGGNAFAVLEDLGLSDVRVSQALLGMAASGDLVSDSLDLQAKAWEENTALVEEAAKRYDTTAAKLEIARNNITEAGIEIGDVFLPILADLAEGVADVASGFADLPEPVKAVIGGFAGVAGVGALAGGAFLLLFPRVIETYKAFQTLSSVSPGVASGLGKIGKAAEVAAGVVILGSAIRALDEAMAPAPASMEEWVSGLLAMDGSIAALDARFNSLDEGLAGWTDIDGFGDAVSRITDPTNTERLNDFGGALINTLTLGATGTGEGAASRRRSLEAVEGLDRALALMVEQGNPELAAKQFAVLTAEAERNGVSVEDLVELFPEYQGLLESVGNEQQIAAESARLQAEAAGVLAQDLEFAYGSLTNYASALGLSEEATEKLIEDSNALGESLGAFIDPLGAYTGLLDEKRAAEEATARATAEATSSATDSWEDYVRDVDVSLDEYMARLEEQLTAQQDWQLNMLILAGRVSEGTLAELARMGPEGAALVADLVNGSDAELDRFDEITAARAKEATDAWGAQLTLAAPVLAEVGRLAGAGVVAQLAAQLQAGTTTIALIAAQYGIELAGGINPILKALGNPPISGTSIRSPEFADGGVVDYYADGGMENHVAQIAPAGAWRVWAEPETGGEAYIPLSPSKRTRSVDIWRQVGDRLGVEFQEFAFGGINDVPRPPSTAPFQAPISTAGDAAMRKAYDEVTTWLAENLEPLHASGGSASGLLPIMAAARQYAMDTYGVGNVGGFARRNIAGTNVLSDHALGKAIDIMTSNVKLGWKIANDFAFGEAHRRFNIENTIWQQSISSRGGPFARMADRGSPTQNHFDHVHADTYARGAIVDFLKPGGLLNPHVRDAGGPLLPGYTLNATGGIEDVVPRHVTDAARDRVIVVPPPSLDGVAVTGRLVMDSDGFFRLVDGRIAQHQRLQKIDARSAR